MVRNGKLAIFESRNISKIKEATPTKIGVHACDINAYLHEFFELIPIKLIFWRPKGNLVVFEGSNISETGEATPTKIGMHAFDINPYLHEFFELIPIN